MHALDSVWETVQREFDSARQQSAQDARADVIRNLHQSLRRLRQYQTETEWTSVLLDGISEFALQAAFFAYCDDVFTLRGQRGLALPEQLSFPASASPAFTSAIATKDTVVAMRRASEVTEALAADAVDGRAYIVPILNGSRVVGVLFAAGKGIDVNALELIAGLASIVLERQANTSLHLKIESAPAQKSEPLLPSALPSPGPKTPRKVTFPSWTNLAEPDRLLHLRAQRFSRVKVAEMQLFKPDACRSGREQANLYLFLKTEIDAARDSYGKQFMTIPSMVDYLHLELVRTAAEGDELKLGADYPGQLL